MTEPMCVYRVRLSKRRQKAGQQPNNTRLVVRHRPLNATEFKMQRYREKQLEPPNEEEEEEEEDDDEEEDQENNEQTETTQQTNKSGKYYQSKEFIQYYSLITKNCVYIDFM